MANGESLLEIENLSKLFPVQKGMFQRSNNFIHAVSDISLQIKAGESLGLVGESGCGKTTIGKLITRLIEPTSGKIFYHDNNIPVDILSIKSSEMKRFRRKVQMIFQDPYESMNPRMSVFEIVSEPLEAQSIGSKADRNGEITNMLERVGLTPPESFLFRYPHELSGGQRQRVAIARALVVTPEFVVADEPTSMLDVSVRTGVMKLMQEFAKGLNITYLYITHDLAVARYMCDKIAVMYLGQIVEIGDTETVLHAPKHPYTKALISSVPIPNPSFKRQPAEIKGGISKALNPPTICRFFDRCVSADETCKNNKFPLLEEKDELHFVACYHAK